MKKNIFDEYKAPMMEILICGTASVLCESPSGTEGFGRNGDSEEWFRK